MNGRDYIDKINTIELYIKELNLLITTSDSDKDVVRYDIDEQEFLRDCLNDYRRILLEREITLN